jgi:hypothetical protein
MRGGEGRSEERGEWGVERGERRRERRGEWGERREE